MNTKNQQDRICLDEGLSSQTSGYNGAMNSGKGDWCIASIDGIEVRVKIVHKSRGKYRIVEDGMDGKYLTTIIDAEDVARVET